MVHPFSEHCAPVLRHCVVHPRIACVDVCARVCVCVLYLLDGEGRGSYGLLVCVCVCVCMCVCAFV